MEWLLAFSALEIILCIVVTRKLRALQRLQREFRLSMLDLEVAFRFADQGRFGEAHTRPVGGTTGCAPCSDASPITRRRQRTGKDFAFIEALQPERKTSCPIAANS